MCLLNDEKPLPLVGFLGSKKTTGAGLIAASGLMLCVGVC